MKEEKEGQEFINPIDIDKVAENPHLLPYAHTVSGPVIKPIDKGKVKGLAVTAMYEQTEMQLDQIRAQVELLMQQAQQIHRKVEVSERIYEADMGFKPILGKIYHLYENKKGKNILSLIGPNEWGKSCPYTFINSVKMMADHTWEIIE